MLFSSRIITGCEEESGVAIMLSCSYRFKLLIKYVRHVTQYVVVGGDFMPQLVGDSIFNWLNDDTAVNPQYHSVMLHCKIH